jgi:hypothetical protein
MIGLMEQHGGESEEEKKFKKYILEKWPPMTPEDMVNLIKEERIQIQEHLTIVDSCIAALSKALMTDDGEETH